MGNNVASIVITYDINRNVTNIQTIAPSDVSVVYNNGLIRWNIGPSYGNFNQLNFVMNQVPKSLGINVYKKTGSSDSERYVLTAFVDENNKVLRPENLGRYASAYTKDGVIKYEIQGNMSITRVDTSTTLARSIDPFRYVTPSVRSFSSYNTTVSNNGTLLYNGQLTTTPELTQVEYTTFTDLNNSNGQYRLDINLTNQGGNIGMQYISTYCPNIVSVIGPNSDGIDITLNTDSPDVMLITNVTDVSLGITTTPNLSLTRITPRLFRLTVVNGTFETLMRYGTKLSLSLLLLPIVI